MKPSSWRKMPACSFSACMCNRSVCCCCNSSNHLQIRVFLLLLCKTWLPVMSALQGGLLWCDQINQRAEVCLLSTELYFAVWHILPGLPRAAAGPLSLTQTWRFPALPQSDGFTTGWHSHWRKVSWCAATLAFASLNSGATSVQSPSFPLDILLFKCNTYINAVLLLLWPSSSAWAPHNFSCPSLILPSLSAYLSSWDAQKTNDGISKAVLQDLDASFLFSFCWHWNLQDNSESLSLWIWGKRMWVKEAPSSHEERDTVSLSSVQPLGWPCHAGTRGKCSPHSWEWKPGKRGHCHAYITCRIHISPSHYYTVWHFLWVFAGS